MPRSDEFFRKSRKTTMKNKEAFTGYNSKMKETARSLRKNMTRQEKHLWYDFLRDYPVKWYRQRSVDRFIVDFFCFKARLVIELRTDILEKYNLEVLRFTNLEVDENFRGVCETIHGKVRERVQLPE